MPGVVALGAVCELEDLTAPQRLPTLDEGGYVKHPTEQDLDAARVRARKFGGFATPSPEVTITQRRRMLESRTPSFYAEEFADLSDGRRILLKDDRGWSSWPQGWPQNMPGGSWKVAGGRALTKQTILILDPDDNEYWMDWVVGRLRLFDIDVNPISIQTAPYRIEFGPRVLHELRQRSSESSMTVPLEDEPLLSVVALGAVCEIAYLTDPPRDPMPHEGGYSYYLTPTDCPTPEELGAAGPESDEAVVYGSYYMECSSEEMQAQRRTMSEAGIREFYAVEFADLSDGRRVTLKDDRGWDFWPVNSPDSLWRVANGRELTRQTIMMLDPHSNEDWEDWVLGCLRSRDIDVDPASVHAAPFRVEFGPLVQRELRRRKSDG